MSAFSLLLFLFLSNSFVYFAITYQKTTRMVTREHMTRAIVESYSNNLVIKNEIFLLPSRHWCFSFEAFFANLLLLLSSLLLHLYHCQTIHKHWNGEIFHTEQNRKGKSVLWFTVFYFTLFSNFYFTCFNIKRQLYMVPFWITPDKVIFKV